MKGLEGLVDSGHVAAILPKFDCIFKFRLEVKEHRADVFDLMKLDEWIEQLGNLKKSFAGVYEWTIEAGSLLCGGSI